MHTREVSDGRRSAVARRDWRSHLANVRRVFADGSRGGSHARPLGGWDSGGRSGQRGGSVARYVTVASMAAGSCARRLSTTGLVVGDRSGA